MESRDQDTKASSESQPEQGGGSNPMMMGMCAEMITAMHKTTSMAAFATPELHGLFGDWMESLEREALAALDQQGEVNAATLASKLKIREKSTIHVVAHLASKGKAVLSIRALQEK